MKGIERRERERERGGGQNGHCEWVLCRREKKEKKNKCRYIVANQTNEDYYKCSSLYIHIHNGTFQRI